MEPAPVCAPYTDEEEVYTPMRMPKSTGNTPTHSFNASFNSQASSSVAGYQSNASPIKLSPHAAPFTPSNNQQTQKIQQHHQHQPQYQQHHQQQQNQQFYNCSQQQQPKVNHQGHQNQQQYRQHQQQQNHQRYANDYNQMPQQHHQNSQQHLQQQHLQQQQPLRYLTSSVQERLKITPSSASASCSSANNYASSSPSSSSKGASSNNYNNYNSRPRQNQSYQHSDGYQNQAAPQQTAAAEVEVVALNYLKTVIQCLNQNPGQFDTVATRFLTIFDGMENNNYVLCNAMEDIFKESIENPNFRYMGAKLYNLLHMLNLKPDSLFHTLLKCKLDYHQAELVEYMNKSNQPQKVRETALFLAELYMQLRGDDSRIHLIAKNIVFALKQLLSKENADNVRCICLTLKLAGYDLTVDCPADMQEIIGKLDAINCQQPGRYPLAANVISLQKNNWGRKLSSSNSLCDEEERLKMAEPLRVSDEPIFYGPDGRELTAEEAEFLTSHVSVAGAAGSTDEEDVGDFDVDFDPEMDEETEKAYKEFCKQNAS